MNQFRVSNAARQKTNSYNAKPKGQEDIELEKTDDPCIAEIAGGSAKNLQDAAAGIVQEKTRCALNEEGQATTAVKEPFKPQLKVPESSDDSMCDGMSKYFEVDVMKTMQEPLSIIDQRKSKKMKQIEQALVTGSDDEEMNVLYKKQLKQTTIKCLMKKGGLAFTLSLILNVCIN